MFLAGIHYTEYMDKMIGKTPHGKNVICKCCVPPSWKVTNKRAAKRAERQAWKKDLSNM